MRFHQVFLKRTFDIAVSLSSLCVLWPVIILCWIVASVETRGNGFFIHPRVGRKGLIFGVVKIKTMYSTRGERSAITADNRSVITRSGRVFRKYKLDELPQLWNVLVGQMSLVGPRPDVPGYADVLKDDSRVILNMRPGITGLASLKYRNEEEILGAVENPRQYNDNVIWPDKVRINCEYYWNYRFSTDLKILYQTVFS